MKGKWEGWDRTWGRYLSHPKILAWRPYGLVVCFWFILIPITSKPQGIPVPTVRGWVSLASHVAIHILRWFTPRERSLAGAVASKMATSSRGGRFACRIQCFTVALASCSSCLHFMPQLPSAVRDRDFIESRLVLLFVLPPRSIVIGGAENDGHENAGQKSSFNRQRLHFVTVKCAASAVVIFLDTNTLMHCA